MNPADDPIAPQRIEETILLIRGQKVMLDRDLALLYGVTTFNLNKAVKRNLDRFPADFMFQLTAAEAEDLRFHFGISSSGHDASIHSLFEAIRRLMAPPPPGPRKEIGFHVKESAVPCRVKSKAARP